jgi:Sigma-70, region 4
MSSEGRMPSVEGRMPSVDSRQGLMGVAPSVYGAAVAAACDHEGAAVVAELAIAGARRRRRAPPPDRRALVEEALLLASNLCPKAPFAKMEPADREAVVLARLGGYTVGEIAVALGITSGDAKRRLRRGLEAIATPTVARPSGRGSDLRPAAQ